LTKAAILAAMVGAARGMIGDGESRMKDPGLWSRALKTDG
jgi:hypothetical protein